MEPSQSPSNSGLSIKDALPFLLSVITAVGGWFAARSTAFAQLSKTVLDASRKLVEQTQALHAQDGAHIARLEERIRFLELELLRKEGEIRQHLQQVDSFKRAWQKEVAKNKNKVTESIEKDDIK